MYDRIYTEMAAELLSHLEREMLAQNERLPVALMRLPGAATSSGRLIFVQLIVQACMFSFKAFLPAAIKHCICNAL